MPVICRSERGCTFSWSTSSSGASFIFICMKATGSLSVSTYLWCMSSMTIQKTKKGDTMPLSESDYHAVVFVVTGQRTTSEHASCVCSRTMRYQLTHRGQFNIWRWWSHYSKFQTSTSLGWYPPITYYWTCLLILDHSYLVRNLTNSKIAEKKALKPVKSWHFCTVSAIFELVNFPTRYEWSKIRGTVQ